MRTKKRRSFFTACTTLSLVCLLSAISYCEITAVSNAYVDFSIDDSVAGLTGLRWKAGSDYELLDQVRNTAQQKALFQIGDEVGTVRVALEQGSGYLDVAYYNPAYGTKTFEIKWSDEGFYAFCYFDLISGQTLYSYWKPGGNTADANDDVIIFPTDSSKYNISISYPGTLEVLFDGTCKGIGVIDNDFDEVFGLRNSFGYPMTAKTDSGLEGPSISLPAGSSTLEFAVTSSSDFDSFIDGVWTIRPTDVDYYISHARTDILSGTVSGVRRADQIIESGVNNPDCTDCVDDRELRFLRAIAKTYMIVLADDGGTTSSILELARKFGVNETGDRLSGISATTPVNYHDFYAIPKDAPDADGVTAIMNDSIIPQIDAVLSDLDTITDSPGDRFRIWFTPAETGLLKPVEVDYAEVLMLKGALYWLKGVMSARQSYDFNVGDDDNVYWKTLEGSLRFNEDLFGKFPDLLNVLPTSGVTGDGKTALADSKQYFIDSVDYYFAAVDHIAAEDVPAGTDPQDDELLFVDPNTWEDTFAEINSKVNKFRDSLVNDTSEVYKINEVKTYEVTFAGSEVVGEIELGFDAIGMPESGKLSLYQCAGAPKVWSIDSYTTDGGLFLADMDYNGTELNYTDSTNLNNANSIMFVSGTYCNNPNMYAVQDVGSNPFVAGGTEMGWNYNGIWSYSLPFSFDFFGSAYTSVYVCSNGFLSFGSTNTYPWNWDSYKRISPFGADLQNNGVSGYGIYIDESQAGQVTIRWAVQYNSADCNFAVVLFDDGNIRFDYGSGNLDAWPRVGISNGTYDSLMQIGENWPWGQGALYGTISEDKNQIDVSFDYWGNQSGSIANLSGALSETSIWEQEIDFNPIYGSSQRYPDPLNLSDIFPLFENNNPLIDTMGSGLGDDATLGGILPGRTQLDWTLEANLQPIGLVYLHEMEAWQLSFDGWPGFWFTDQLVFDDIVGDVPSDCPVNFVDIDQVYMGYDDYGLYGTISLYDVGDISKSQLKYEVELSHSDQERSIVGSMKIQITITNGVAMANIGSYEEVWAGYYGYQMMDPVDVQLGSDRVDFRVSWMQVPGYLPGRYLNISSKGSETGSRVDYADTNNTHIQIGNVGTINGTLNCNGRTDGPLFLQVFTDPSDPEGSLIRSIMLEQPGAYSIASLGLGWEGYLRAYTPLFGRNLLEEDTFRVYSDPVLVSLWQETLNGVDVTINYPPLLENGIWLQGDTPAGSDIPGYYAFDAVENGTYSFDLNNTQFTGAAMSLCQRNGRTSLIGVPPYQSQLINNWICPNSGRYYIVVEDTSWDQLGGSYQLKMTTDVTANAADISGSEGPGVRDFKVDLYDYAVLASKWMDSCGLPYWCDGADIDKSGFVDQADVMLLATDWLRVYYVTVIDESHVYTMTGSQSLQLTKSNIAPATIEIEGIGLYIQPSDYTVRQVDGITFIDIVAVGNIFSDGDQTLLIDYDYTL